MNSINSEEQNENGTSPEFEEEELQNTSEQEHKKNEQADDGNTWAKGESSEVEFKSTLRVSLHSGKPDDRGELACLKTIAAFQILEYLECRRITKKLTKESNDPRV